MRVNLFILILMSTFSGLHAQDPAPPAGLASEELRTWLRDNWFLPWHSALSYDEARQTMYGSIDNEGGNIYCVYTGFYQPAAEVTFPDPINTEHTVPQSWFNSQLPMRSDIHHIFPTHSDANTARGSLPFAEVTDSTVDVWMTGNGGSGLTTSSSVPSSNIDAYSEVRHNVNFEPIENHKGNTARAVFYFYTMYPTQAGPISQIGNIEQMYQWHLMDPPDASEIERNEQTKEAQGNYNPYISSPELLGLAWDFVTSVKEEELDFGLFPNPSHESFFIETSAQVEGIEVMDLIGHTVFQSTSANLKVDVSSLQRGVYLVKVKTDQGTGVKKWIKN